MPPPRYPPASPYPAQGKYTPTPKPKPDPVPKTKKVAPTKPKKPSVAQVSAAKPLTPLDQLVAQYASQQAELKAQQLGQQQAATQFSQQMLQYLNDQPGAINALYQHAVDQTNQFGQTSADQFRAANPNAQIQADLGAIGAGPEQQAKVGGDLNSIYGTGGATLYAAGGAIPATELAANQASAGLYANSLPGIQALQARQLFAQLLANQQKDTSALSSDKAKTLFDAQQQTTGGASAGKATVRQLANGQLQAFDPYTGSPLGKPYGPTKPLSAGSQKSPTVRSLANGQFQAIDPYSGQPLGKPYGPVRVKGSGKAPAKKNPTVRQLANGQLQAIDPYTGRPLGKPYGPTRASGGAGGGSRNAPSSVDLGRVDRAAKAALIGVRDKIWAGIPGSDQPKDSKAYKDAQEILRSRVQQNFGTFMYRVITAIGPHLKSFGYSPAAIKYKAFQYVSALVTPPKSYRPPKAVEPGKAGAAVSAAYKVQQQVGGVIAFAGSQIGKPYVFGSGPDFKSFDCSDLIQAAYKAIGVKLPRDTYGQIKAGRPVSLQNIQPGDLVFPSKGHVVLYIGNGQVIAAPHTGALVQYQNLSDFGNPVAVRRVLADGANFV